MGSELVRDARFWVAVVLLVKTVLFYAVPSFPPEVWAAVDGVLAVVIGSMATQSAARIAGATRQAAGRGVAEVRAGRYAVSLVDVLLVLGLALLAAGLGGFDWRLALIACGALLLAGGAVGMVRGS